MGNMIGTLVLACFVTGAIIGWLLRTIFSVAQISWYQEQMQRKILYWQGEATYARASAEEYAQLLAASTGDVSEPRERLFDDETSGEDYNA
jgi:hypothetical protein